MQKEYLRIIDVNINRAKEGLRVVEEVARFILNDQALTKELKTIRQTLLKLSKSFGCRGQMIMARDSADDVGANAVLQARKDIFDIVQANMSRTQEALRAIEEFSTDGMPFQKLRFDVYTIEKTVIEKLQIINPDTINAVSV
ncbi:MAG: hypothetical protein ABIH39_08315 [Candidatus Margulisiibacteriota bacterium]